jgi:hypothetical protein
MRLSTIGSLVVALNAADVPAMCGCGVACDTHLVRPLTVFVQDATTMDAICNATVSGGVGSPVTFQPAPGTATTFAVDAAVEQDIDPSNDTVGACSFSAPFSGPGTYTVTVSLSGFQTKTTTVLVPTAAPTQCGQPMPQQLTILLARP